MTVCFFIFIMNCVNIYGGYFGIDYRLQNMYKKIDRFPGYSKLTFPWSTLSLDCFLTGTIARKIRKTHGACI
jgi:hypothetical protein